MKPIFIGGCPRSGTTFLASLLGSHPEVVAVPESQFIVDVYRSLGRPARKLEVEEVLSKIAQNWRYKATWKGASKGVPKETRKEVLPYSGIVRKLVKAYVDKSNAKTSEFWVDHTPSNIRRLEELFSLFPESKSIHIVRDGRACANSVIPLDWGPNTVKHAASWWLKNLSFGLAAENRWSNSKVTRVTYEDLLTCPEKTLKNISDWLGIDFDSKMIEGKGVKVPQYTRDQHELVGGSGEPDRATAWREELRERQIEVFEYFAGPMLPYLGYSLENSAKPETPGTYEDIYFELKQVFKSKALNSIRKTFRKYISLSREIE